MPSDPRPTSPTNGTAKADVIAYVDEAGAKGLSRRLTPGRDDEVGLFCALAFPVARLAEMKARFQPGFDRFLAAVPEGEKAHITDAYKPGYEAWAAVADEVRDEFFALVRELEIPVIYEARRLRIDRQSHEMHENWLEEVKSGRTSSIRIQDRPSDKRVEQSLMLGLALKLDCLCEDCGLAKVDVLFDETDLADIYREEMTKARTAGEEKEYVFKGYDTVSKQKIERKAKIALQIVDNKFRLDAHHLGEVHVIGKEDPLVLATDFVANGLFRHFRDVLPPTSYLNRPESVQGWALEERIYGVRDDAIEDMI